MDTSPASSQSSLERTFQITSRIESIYPLEQKILAAVRSMGFSEDELFSLRLALDEALINAIMHGNGGHEHKRVVVNLSVDPSHVSVSVADEGDGFDIDSLFDPTAEEYIHATHGRGVFLIRQFMDEVAFNERGNEITFTLRRSNP